MQHCRFIRAGPLAPTRRPPHRRPPHVHRAPLALARAGQHLQYLTAKVDRALLLSPRLVDVRISGGGAPIAKDLQAPLMPFICASQTDVLR
jgi:hypothetical protein